MAKKQANLDDIFRRTEGEEPEKPKTVSGGFSLREDVLAELDAIAGELGVSRNAVIRWALHNFVIEYRAGNVKPEVKTHRTLNMPD